MERALRIMITAVMVLVLVSFLLTYSLKQETLEKLERRFAYSGEMKNISIYSLSMNIPAVDNEGNGVITKLFVEAKHGKGRALVDINQLLFWVDTQQSIRIAKFVAQNVTGVDISNVDLIYSIETNASIIGGPSAGAALTIATIAVLENKTINPKVMITGTIDYDGSIGQVGEILAKARASRNAGAEIFLVPLGQAVQNYYKPIRSCEKFGPVTYCTTEYKVEKIDISKEVGIEVKEVSRINEALKYFFGE